jgi:peptidoglycan/LPS O-acetylase OafA/YrhL
MGYAKNLLTGYPFHFVPLLLLSYLLSPLMVIIARRHGFLLLALVGLVQLLLLGIIHKGSLGFVFPSQARLLLPPVISGSLSEWAIYFPLGLVFGMHARRWTPMLMRARFVLAGASAALFVLAMLHFGGRIDFALAKFLCPVPFVLCLPLIQRQAIPFVRQLEGIGKHSYGVYLTHLLVLDLALWVIAAAAPGLLSYPVLVVPALVALGLAIPLAVMDWAARLPTRRAYRYVFG